MDLCFCLKPARITIRDVIKRNWSKRVTVFFLRRIEGGYNQVSGYDFRTEQGWFHIEHNEELTILLADHVGWCELFDYI